MREESSDFVDLKLWVLDGFCWRYKLYTVRKFSLFVWLLCIRFFYPYKWSLMIIDKWCWLTIIASFCPISLSLICDVLNNPTPPSSPYPGNNLWNLWMYYLIWQKECEYSENLEMEGLFRWPNWNHSTALIPSLVCGQETQQEMWGWQSRWG